MPIWISQQGLWRSCFFYFLSAFSTIRLTILCEKLTAMQVDASLVSWIADYLAEGSCVSSKLCLTRWSTTLGLFTLYTTDGRHCTETFRSFLMSLRWLNASVKVIHWRRVPGTRPHMDSFVMWCKQNYLELNITKTNELIVDFRRIMKPVTPVSIQGLHVDIVCINTLEYTLTGLNTTALFRKRQRWLKSVNNCWTMLRIFYCSGY